MFGWLQKFAENSGSGKPANAAAASVLYRLTLVSPTWAGAIAAVYSVFLCRFGALRIRLK
jgi:hypothetical protein